MAVSSLGKAATAGGASPQWQGFFSLKRVELDFRHIQIGAQVEWAVADQRFTIG